VGFDKKNKKFACHFKTPQFSTLKKIKMNAHNNNKSDVSDYIIYYN